MLPTGAGASKMSHDMRTQEALQSRQKKFNKEDKGTGGIEFAWHDVQSPEVNL